MNEEKAFKKYSKTLNKLCKKCEYSCIYRGHREKLKVQRIGHKQLRCPKEYDMRRDKILKVKLK